MVSRGRSCPGGRAECSSLRSVRRPRRQSAPYAIVDGIPLPPETMRSLIGRTDEAEFLSGDTTPVLAGAPAGARVLDFGCGCGRTARGLMRDPRPASYLGLDLHRGMVEWCATNLTPLDPRFRFAHHDVENPGFNPGAGKPRTRAVSAADGSFDLVYAASVFTHLRESQVPFYLREFERVLAAGGVIRSTWFLFDKGPFPMMQTFQNALYINEHDPTNAVIFDRDWFLQLVSELGLVVTASIPPGIRGYQWWIDLRRRGDALAVELPVDEAPLGFKPPPVVDVKPTSVG